MFRRPYLLLHWLFALLNGSDRWAMDTIRKAMPPRRRDLNQPLEKLRVRSGPRLARRIRRGIKNRENLLVLSDPGIGKTVTILKELEGLRQKGAIRGYLHFTVTKSANWADWFENKLTVRSRDGSPQIDLIPAPFKDALNEGNKEGEIIIFVDELTRANGVLVDAFLEAIEQGTFLIEGRKVKLPIRFIFAGNMPGSDGSCSSLSPAFRSRKHEIMILFAVDIDVLACLFLPERFKKHAKETSYRGPMPSPELFRQMATIWLILNGWPLERPCYTETPEKELRLVRELAEADPQLKADLEIIARLSFKGPDARKPLEWLERVIGLAMERSPESPITVEDLIEEAAVIMRAGYRSKLNEDRQRKELLDLDRATGRVVRRVFNSGRLKAIIAQSEGPYALACRLAGGEDVEKVSETLWGHHLDLEDRDPEAAPAHFRKLARLVASLEEDVHDLAALAVQSGWLRKDGKFNCLADKQLCEQLGGRFAELAAREVARPELLRDLLQKSKYAWEFAPELYAVLHRPALAARLEEVVRLLDCLLDDTPPAHPPAIDAVFRGLLRRIARHTSSPHAAVLRRAVRLARPSADVSTPAPAAKRPQLGLARFLVGPMVLGVGLLMAAAPYSDTPRSPVMELKMPDNPCVFVLLACGLAATYLALDRVLQLRKLCFLPQPLRGMIQGLAGKHLSDLSAIEQECLATPSPLAQAILEVLTERKSSPRGLRQVAESAAEKATARAERNTEWLAYLVQLAPLVGLAGSLYAMIGTVTAQTQDIKVLTAGFFASLSSSLIGLAVAGPCLLLHGWFCRRADALHDEMTALLHTLASALRPPRSGKKHDHPGTEGGQ